MLGTKYLLAAPNMHVNQWSTEYHTEAVPL
jgi:hypothetical protein